VKLSPFVSKHQTSHVAQKDNLPALKESGAAQQVKKTADNVDVVADTFSTKGPSASGTTVKSAGQKRKLKGLTKALTGWAARPLRHLKRAAVLGMVGITLLGPQLSHAQSNAQPLSPLNFQTSVLMGTSVTKGKLRRVKTDFHQTQKTDVGTAVFRMKVRPNQALAKALQEGAQVVLSAPFGAHDHVGSNVKVNVEDGMLTLTAQARGSALTKAPIDPLLLVLDNNGNITHSIDIDVNRVTAHDDFSAASQQQSADSHKSFLKTVVKQMKQRFEDGVDTPLDFGDIEGWQTEIQRLRQTINKLETAAATPYSVKARVQNPRR